jgi:predicted DNA-binding antitoxin AbrB/MazE fold protein
MKIAVKGEYRNGVIEIKEKVNFEEGTKVLIIPEIKSNITISELLLQQKIVEKIWDSEEEDIYGEV